MSAARPYSPKRRRGLPILLGILLGVVLLVIGFATIPLFTGFILLVGALLFALYKILDWLAKDKNILFTTLEPGQGKFIMRGEDLDEILIGDRDRRLDNRNNICRIYDRDSDGNPKKDSSDKAITLDRDMDLFEKWFGWRYVGIARHVLVRDMDWYEFEDMNDPAKGLRRRKEKTDFIYTTRAFMYGARVSDAEVISPISNDKPGEDGISEISVNINLAVTLYILNPERAVFDVEGGLHRALTIMIKTARVYAARRNYHDLQRESSADGNQGLWEFIKSENPDAKDYQYTADPELIEYLGGHDKYLYFSKYGVLVDTVEITSIELTNDPDGKVQKALNAIFIASQEAKAKIAKAEGDKQATILRSEGDKKALENIAAGQSKVVEDVYIKAAGSAGVTAAALQAVGDVSKAWEKRGKKEEGNAS